MNEALKEEAIHTFNDLLAALDTVKRGDINTAPFEGSWTAGQLSDHLIKATGDIPQLSKGKTEKNDRDPSAMIEAIKKVFLDFTIK